MKKISEQQVALFEFELTRGDAKAKKVALQQISAAYRNGSYISGDRISDIEGRITSLLLVVGQDLKVVRWALNTLAQLGRWSTCQNYIEKALSLYEGNPEIEAAGVAALCRMLKVHTRDIEALGQIPPAIWKLAALQTSSAKNIDLGDLRINIQRDNKEILKLALIVIGLNKDIAHLFDPRHSNGTFVRELCRHDDAIVQQYSVWAVTENNNLTLEHLGLRFSEIEGLRPNVQSKMYQLAAQRVPDLRDRLDLIAKGSYSTSAEAREGLAKGVRDVYFDGVEEVIIPWFQQESVPGIRKVLVEHVAAYSDDCGPYADLARKIYDDEPDLQKKILIGAEGTRLYGELKAAQQPDLLSFLDQKDDLVALLNASKAMTIPKITVCMLLAAPRDEIRLRLDQEVRDIAEKIKLVKGPKVSVEIIPEWAVRISEVTDHLLNARPNVVHFSGHGEGGAIMVENEVGMSTPLNADGLSALIEAIGNIDCVVLNACFSDSIGIVLSKHVSCVIGCGDTIDDDAAVIFGRSFYRSLAHGRSYTEAYKIAVAEVLAQAGPDEAGKYRIHS